jgi:hypothetical protein
MPKYADSLVNGIMSVASPTDDGSGKFTITQEDLDTLLANMERPKRPPSAFLLYKTEKREEFREKFPEVTKAGDLAKLVAEHYESLSDNEKQVYKDKYSILKDTYMEKMRRHKQYFPDKDNEQPRRKRGRPRKNPVDQETTLPKVAKKRGRKSKNKNPEVPKERVDTSEDETNNLSVRETDSESDCESPEFTTITHPNTGVQYSVDLNRGLYYDINAPWGKSLGTYDKDTNTFN